MEDVGVLLNQLLVELSLCGNFIIAADMDMFAIGVHLAVNLTKMTANFQRAPFRKTGFVMVASRMTHAKPIQTLTVFAWVFG